MADVSTPLRSALGAAAPATPQSGYSPSPSETSAAPTPEKLQASIPVVMEAVAALQALQVRPSPLPDSSHTISVERLERLGAQEENSSLRAERDALRSSGACPEPAPAPARAPADAWAASAPPPRPAADAFSAAQLCGAFEAQRQYLRGRSAGRQALRHAIRRTDDAGIRSQLHSLEEQRARHVRSEWKSLRRIQRLLEGELDTSLAVDDEGDFDGGLSSEPLGFDGGSGGRAGSRSKASPSSTTKGYSVVRPAPSCAHAAGQIYAYWREVDAQYTERR